jgi:RHS repeat-associated protein
MGTTTYTTFNGMLVHENRGGVETEYVPDTLGSVMMCRDVNGNTTYTADYWPYGEVAVSSGTNPSPWSFVGTLGYYTDSAPGSLYVRARTLLPLYGRWATVDKLWPDREQYAYALNMPMTHVDPSGLLVEVCVREVVRYVGGTAYAHWFFNTSSCGARGYGPDGLIPGWNKNASGEPVNCYKINVTPAQENCICNQAKSTSGGSAPGHPFQWLPKGCGSNGYEFVQAILAYCLGWTLNWNSLCDNPRPDLPQYGVGVDPEVPDPSGPIYIN